jgi:RNA polymerase sigma-70 factor (sigma-E family)
MNESHPDELSGTGAPRPVAEVVSFEDFVGARGRALWRSAWLLTGDAQKAEDLLQTALMKCWRRWPSIQHNQAVESYVRRALVSTYTDWWRRKWTGEVPTEFLPETIAHAEPDLTEDRRNLVQALALLPRGQRAILVLRYFDDLTEAQTAEALGITVGTVKSQSARAMATLRTSPLLQEEA